MSEVLEQEKPTVEVKATPDLPNPFQTESWSEPAAVKVEEKPIAEQQPIVEQKKEEITFSKEWFVKEFEVDDPAIIKAEREELKTLKANPPKAEEITFADEQSKQIHELLREGKPENKKAVREFLQTQEQLEELSSLTEVNKDNAADIIKLQIKLKNKQLTASEVEFEYKQNYVAPKEPVQKASEMDEDFQERMDEWKEKVDQIETKRVIAAKMAQPELIQLKAEIKLPEITKAQPQIEQPSQESLDALKKAREGYLNILDSEYKKFEGFNTIAKDADGLVEIPVTFKVPEEDKIAIREKLKDFDIAGYIDSRWFDEKGNPKVDTMMADMYLLENPSKVIQGVANDAAAKRLAHQIKVKSNIDVSGGASGTFQPADNSKTQMDELAKVMFST
jgi:hypothetical protein